MSVLIKDMEKPKYCYEVIDGEPEYCPFLNTDDDCVLLLEKGICEGTWTDQYSKCPLAEEPECKKGKWQWCGNHHLCSECDEWALTRWDEDECDEVDILTDFCPNCGCRMGGEEDG